jgi:hypothetical protein
MLDVTLKDARILERPTSALVPCSVAFAHAIFTRVYDSQPRRICHAQR